jgi:hypothetical protein
MAGEKVPCKAFKDIIDCDPNELRALFSDECSEDEEPLS